MYTPSQLAKGLVTKKEYELLPPVDQGYVVYMQAERPGSELKYMQSNPYEVGSLNYHAWQRGNVQAMMDTQDAED